LGVLYTFRDQRGVDADALQTMGSDLRLATTNFRGRGQNLNFRTHFLWTTDRVPSNDGGSWKFNANLDFPNDIWVARVNFDHYEPDYDPGVGFRFRAGFRQYDGNFFWNPRPGAGSAIRQLNFGGQANVLTDLEGRKISHRLTVKPLGINMQSGDNLSFTVSPQFERLDSDFLLPGGLLLEEGGRYDFTRWQIQAGAADQRILSGFAMVEWGSFYSGTREDLSLNATLRPWPGISLNASGQWSELDLVEGRVATTVLQAKLGTQPAATKVVVTRRF
jgi:hypothetical protein